MRLALLFNKAEYDNSTNEKVILSAEIVDPTLTDLSETVTFTDPNTSIEYIKIYNDLTYMTLEYKRTIISNYSDCYYDKNNGRIVPQYTTPANRAITNFDVRYPLLTDQYLVPFV